MTARRPRPARYARIARARLRRAGRALLGRDEWERRGRPLTDAEAAAVRPVFVLSTGRCGTRWLTTVLDRSRRVLANHELQPELVRQSRLAWEAGPDALPRLTEIVRACRDDLVSSAHARGRTYVETNHRLTFFAPAVLAAYPESRFVHLVRHPGPFVRSGVRRGWYTGTRLDLARIAMPDGAAWARLDRPRRIAWLWNETQRFVDDFLAGLPDDRWLRLRSEDLFADPAAALALCRFVGADDLPPQAVRRAQGRKVNAQRTGRFPRFDDWPDALVRDVAGLCPLAARHGYGLGGDGDRGR